MPARPEFCPPGEVLRRLAEQRQQRRPSGYVDIRGPSRARQRRPPILKCFKLPLSQPRNPVAAGGRAFWRPTAAQLKRGDLFGGPNLAQEPEHELSERLTADDILTRLRALQTPTSQIERTVLETAAELQRTISETVGTSFAVPAVAEALAELAHDLSPLVESSAAFAKLGRDLSNAQRAVQEAFQIASETTTMTSIISIQRKQGLRGLIDMLPDSEIMAAARYLEFLISSREAPIDPEMLKRIDAARAEPPAGVPHEEILREYGL